jgi:hypothetical protein
MVGRDSVETKLNFLARSQGSTESCPALPAFPDVLHGVAAALGTLAVAASVLCSNGLALPASAADSTNTASGRLLLCNGDSFPGNLVSIDTNQTVLWKNPDVAEPVAFKLNRISQMDLSPPAPLAL